MSDLESVADEVRILRERTHKLASNSHAHDWRIQTVERFALKYGPLVDEMIETDKIADAISQRMKETHSLRLSLFQQAIATVAVLAAISSPIVAAFH